MTALTITSGAIAADQVTRGTREVDAKDRVPLHIGLAVLVGGQLGHRKHNAEVACCRGRHPGLGNRLVDGDQNALAITACGNGGSSNGDCLAGQCVAQSTGRGPSIFPRTVSLLYHKKQCR